ncbi:MAG: type II toxin-antitoxin system prevent-host-death family antitoxin [Chloroflexota bacterium]|nr:MAG: type II toxin-antitoxin system prevent-host-death family antitoxin [Chloroflexota bacterium]
MKNRTAWQLQEAKQKFSQVVRQALDEGPQIVTRHGEAVVVIVAAAEFAHLTRSRIEFNEFLLSGPPTDDIDVERDRASFREIEL